jgi:hypothetical protein
MARIIARARPPSRYPRSLHSRLTGRCACGTPNSFCRRCGGHVFGGDHEGELSIAVRLGCVEGDPEVKPTWRAPAPDWYEIPDDDVDRFQENRPR